MYTLDQITDKVNLAISEIEYNKEPHNLYDPIRYILSIGGKRIRPALMLMGYNLYKEDIDSIMMNAIALETYHKLHRRQNKAYNKHEGKDLQKEKGWL